MASTTAKDPVGEVDPRFSSPNAEPTPWIAVRQDLESAEVYWLATVRKKGRPHVTPLAGVFHEDTFHFCTGADEQKARNLAANARVVATTGCNSFTGLDVVIEGDAVRATDTSLLTTLADLWNRKYPGVFQFQADGPAFRGAEGNIALVFEVRARKVFAFEKGETFAQTRWRF